MYWIRSRVWNVWGLHPQQALRSAGGWFTNEVSEPCRGHVGVKACSLNKYRSCSAPKDMLV